MMTRALVALLVLALGAPVLRAQDEAKPASRSLKEKVDALVADWNERTTTFRAAARKFRSNPEGEAPRAPEPGPCAKALRETIAGHEGDAAAVPALELVMDIAPGEDALWARTTLLEKHRADAEAMTRLARKLQRDFGAEAAEVMTSLTKHADETVALWATYGRFSQLKSTLGVGRYLSGQGEDVRKRYVESYGADAVTQAIAAAADPSALETAMLGFLEKVAAMPAAKTTDLYRNRTVAAAVAGEIFEVKNLSIGKTAPDIKGVDVDGTEFSLSDYRGKVVFLDFWGHW